MKSSLIWTLFILVMAIVLVKGYRSGKAGNNQIKEAGIDFISAKKAEPVN